MYMSIFLQKIKAAADSENPDPNEFAPACKEVSE